MNLAFSGDVLGVLSYKYVEFGILVGLMLISLFVHSTFGWTTRPTTLSAVTLLSILPVAKIN